MIGKRQVRITYLRKHLNYDPLVELLNRQIKNNGGVHNGRKN